MNGIFFFVGFWALSLVVFVLVIRNAIDGSKSAAKMDVLIQEIRLLRNDIKNNKHIIDKKV